MAPQNIRHSYLLSDRLLGTHYSFNLNLTEHGPGLGDTPDAFSLFLADNGGSLIPTTTDPTGSNALFLFNIDGTSGGNLNLYSSTDLPISWQVTLLTDPPVLGSTVPTPSILWLLASGGLVFWSIRKRVSAV